MRMNTYLSYQTHSVELTFSFLFSFSEYFEILPTSTTRLHTNAAKTGFPKHDLALLFGDSRKSEVHKGFSGKNKLNIAFVNFDRVYVERVSALRKKVIFF